MKYNSDSYLIWLDVFVNKADTNRINLDLIHIRQLLPNHKFFDQVENEQKVFISSKTF